MKKLLIAIFLLTSATIAVAQQLSIEGGKTSSSFLYKNSEGSKLENLHSTDHIYLSIGFRKNIFTKNLYLNINGAYNNYGATGSSRELDNYYDWDVSYLGLDLGLDYYVYTTRKIGFYIKGAASAEFLIQGTQTINNQKFNLLKEEDFNSPFYFFRGGLGAEYKASGMFTFYTQYMYGKGAQFKNIQGHLKIHDQRFGIGLRINIGKQLHETPVNPAALPGNQDVEQLKKEVEANSERLRELEANRMEIDSLKKMIARKEQKVSDIKAAIGNALQPYKGSDLTINDVDGQVRVTMGSGMLFKSGSAELSDEGVAAINKLGNVLAENPDLNILIVGHTDNQPFKHSARTNWDLSVERATAVVAILTRNKNLNPKNLTAAGKGEQEPIADNSTEEGREKNRRIEIIISPELGKLSNLIKN